MVFILLALWMSGVITSSNTWRNNTPGELACKKQLPLSTLLMVNPDWRTPSSPAWPISSKTDWCTYNGVYVAWPQVCLIPRPVSSFNYHDTVMHGFIVSIPIWIKWGIWSLCVFSGFYTREVKCPEHDSWSQKKIKFLRGSNDTLSHWHFAGQEGLIMLRKCLENTGDTKNTASPKLKMW